MSPGPKAPADSIAIRLSLQPEAPEAGADCTLVAEVAPERCPEATHLAVVDATGIERARAALCDTPEARRFAALPLVAPLSAGAHHLHACLLAGADAAAAGDPLLRQDFVVPVRAHPVCVVLWGLPPAPTQGAPVSFHLGLKCPCGCSSARWPYRLTDAEGRILAEGRVGDTPWSGTDGLCYAEVTVPAPHADGIETWTAVCEPPDLPAAHAPGRAELRLTVRPAPEVTLTVVVTEAATGAPVPRAKVVAHPFRAVADAAGVAALRVPKGRYRIQVSGTRYFAAQTEGDVTEDTTVTAALEIDRDFTDADAWA